LEKFANVCNVLAINVNFLEAFSLGYSNEEGKNESIKFLKR
jgi:hypothetical protein